MDKAKLMMSNGMHTVVPIQLEDGKPPPKFEHQGRTFTLHHRTVGTGASEIRAVYTEVANTSETKR